MYGLGDEGIRRYNEERGYYLAQAEEVLRQVQGGQEVPKTPNSTSETPGDQSENSGSPYEAQLRSMVVSRGYQPTGKTWLITADPEGNKLLVQQALCSNMPDRHCQKLFIAFNDRFLGTDTFLPSWEVHDVAQEGVGRFSAIYNDLSDPYRAVLPVKVTYTWDGRKLTASGTPPTRPSAPLSTRNK